MLSPTTSILLLALGAGALSQYAPFNESLPRNQLTAYKADRPFCDSTPLYNITVVDPGDNQCVPFRSDQDMFSVTLGANSAHLKNNTGIWFFEDDKCANLKANYTYLADILDNNCLSQKAFGGPWGGIIFCHCCQWADNMPGCSRGQARPTGN